MSLRYILCKTTKSYTQIENYLLTLAKFLHKKCFINPNLGCFQWACKAKHAVRANIQNQVNKRQLGSVVGNERSQTFFFQFCSNNHLSSGNHGRGF